MPGPTITHNQGLERPRTPTPDAGWFHRSPGGNKTLGLRFSCICLVPAQMKGVDETWIDVTDVTSLRRLSMVAAVQEFSSSQG